MPRIVYFQITSAMQYISLCTTITVLIDFLREYDGKFDNLLYFFAFQYNLIQEEQIKRQVMLLISCMIDAMCIIVEIAFVFNVLLIMVRINWIFLNGHRFLEKNNRDNNVLSRTFLKICFQARIVVS